METEKSPFSPLTKSTERLLITGLILCGWAFIILLRLFDLQVFAHDEYVKLGESQQEKLERVEAPRGAILEGRDIGTVVFPDADAKFFLEASPDIRARRRYEELFEKGVDSSLHEVLADQTQRDRDDSSRKVAPLKAAEDAIRLDSTALPLSEVVQTIERQIRLRLPGTGRAP